MNTSDSLDSSYNTHTTGKNLATSPVQLWPRLGAYWTTTDKNLSNYILFYSLILRKTHITGEKPDMSRFSNILQTKVKFYKYQRWPLEAEVLFIILSWIFK